MSFSIPERIVFFLLMTVVFNNAVKANNISIETTARDVIQPRVFQTDTSKLMGLSREKAQELVGKPKRSEEFFPFSHNCTTVDYYPLKVNGDEYLRISYDKEGKVSGAEVELSPYATPKFIAKETTSINLTDTELRNFLNSMSEDKLRDMSAEQFTKKLGKPDRSWHETCRAGGRDWHFFNSLYYLSENGRRAFIVRFNEASNSVYEYRVQSISQ